MQKLFTTSFLVLASLISVSTVASAQGPALTEHHKVLADEVGTWTAEMKIYVPGLPEPLSGTGSETNRAIGDGLWIISDFKSTIEGQPFEGHGTFGYDSAKEKYVGTWIDSMTSSIAFMEGTYDEATKTFTYHAEMPGPDGAMVRTKMTTTTQEDGSRLFVTYTADGEEWTKSMEILYKKK